MKYFSPGENPVFIFLLLAGLQLTVNADQIVYDDALENGWANWSWATVNLTNTSPVHGGSDSISVTANNSASDWQALYLEITPMDSSTFTNLTFWINGGASGGQLVQVIGTLNGTPQTAVQISSLPVNSWRQVNVPLSALGVANKSNFDGLWLQAEGGSPVPTFYVDDITLQSGPPPQPGTNANINIQIDALGNRHAISPLIYGVAFALSSSVLQDLNAPLQRSGGNAETRYNWQLNATSRAADWYFESIGDNPSTAGADGDSFIQESKAADAQPMLTIPIIGWVAKLGPSRATLGSYAVSKYGPQVAADNGWGNGISTNGLNITNNDPTDANMTADTNFQAGWVQHLTNQWGTAANGGLRYYIMDNEWSLWQETHRDVHPVGATRQEVLGKFCDYSTTVKDIDSNALVLGPEEWGWPGYLNSGYDLQWSGAHNDDYPDRAANGGQDFSPWFLSQVQQRSQAAGRRLLDCFTLHIYPAAYSAFDDAMDPGTQLLRNQTTRDFWDTNYVDPSWINSVIALIPRMKSWVATNYPGTKIGITEYNWGAEDYMNGATAQADILGIFGREGLDLATRWTTPATGSPVYNSMKIYRNYDGNKSTFGDTSILAAVPNPDDLSAFGAVRTSDGAMTLMVINKDLINASPITANIANFDAAGTAQCWQLTAANTIAHLADISLTNGVLKDLLPAQSITLFVLPPSLLFHLRPDAGDTANPFNFHLDGQAGQTYALQSSTDMVHWINIGTNTLATNSFPFSISAPDSMMQFYRGIWLR